MQCLLGSILCCLVKETPPRHSPNKLLSEESVESLGYHCGSWVGEAIQLGWGLLDGEGRLLELSLPFSFAGERGTPSPANQNPGSETLPQPTIKKAVRARCQ
jgi:hypothetical protein